MKKIESFNFLNIVFLCFGFLFIFKTWDTKIQLPFFLFIGIILFLLSISYNNFEYQLRYKNQKFFISPYLKGSYVELKKKDNFVLIFLDGFNSYLWSIQKGRRVIIVHKDLLYQFGDIIICNSEISKMTYYNQIPYCFRNDIPKNTKLYYYGVNTYSKMSINEKELDIDQSGVIESQNIIINSLQNSLRNNNDNLNEVLALHERISKGVKNKVQVIKQ